MITLPQEYVNRTKTLLKEESDAYFAALQVPCRSSYRINPKKNYSLLENSSPIPWTDYGYYLTQKPVFTLDPLFHAGHYYVQEANSMIIEKVFKQLNFKSPIKVLDLCAAPGGKSTHILSILDSDSVVHCHELNSLRAEVLKQNIEKWGFPNSIVTSGPIYKLCQTGVKYDVIMLDAPCSGEGMFRKEPDAIKQWNSNKINHCVNLQSEILNYASELLAPGGILIYSTCTFNQEENESILSKFALKYQFESIPFAPIKEADLLLTDYLSIHTARAMPHRMEGEGLSFSLLRKNISTDTIQKRQKKNTALPDIKFNEWINTELFPLQALLIKGEYLVVHLNTVPLIQFLENAGIKILSAGTSIGHYKGKDWFPSQALATSLVLSPELPKINLDLTESLHYLRADSNFLPIPILENQWQIIAYKNAPLGWVKRIENKFKNYYPKNMRIHSL
ncbi:MAG: hypothetical protein HOP11_01605 [Saprospiraceae bacterium]|nr:hypothetical protein [Saprospiraceae bacterium]